MVLRKLKHIWAELNKQAGQGLAEYALILALIAIVSILALLFLGTQISDKLSIIGDSMTP